MHISRIHIQAFKRFTDLTICDIPASARLVVITGPNGCGKSSIFDAFRKWHGFHGLGWMDNDELYYKKVGLPSFDWDKLANIAFHEKMPNEDLERKKLFYIRSAYRNEADFTSGAISKMNSVLDAPKAFRLIDNDTTVSDNYNRLISATLAGVYSGACDQLMVPQLRDKYVGEIQASMGRVFDGLVLRGVGDPLNLGTFQFEKGASRNFHYKNLSGGEKSAFNLLLDILVKRIAYDNTIFCIDEPELHIHTRLQALLLRELFSLISSRNQLWIATHSIGMIRAARDLESANPGQVAFLDVHGNDFDGAVTIRPTRVDRAFWSRTLAVALDDLATLVAPKQLVLCEGRLVGSAGDARKAEFDATCYREIFSKTYPDTDFMSVGSGREVAQDTLGVGQAVQALVSGTKIIRLIDRDDRSEQEIAELEKSGVRVLSKRHIESYLLEDELLIRLCESQGRADIAAALIAAKGEALRQSSVVRGNPIDDIKSASGDIYNASKKLLQLVGFGSDVRAFMRSAMVPLVTPDTQVYKLLQRDIFMV